MKDRKKLNQDSRNMITDTCGDSPLPALHLSVTTAAVFAYRMLAAGCQAVQLAAALVANSSSFLASAVRIDVPYIVYSIATRTSDL